jgi:hypothetical protein
MATKVKFLVLGLLERHARPANAALAISSVELAGRVYQTRRPNLSQRTATRRALCALVRGQLKVRGLPGM